MNKVINFEFESKEIRVVTDETTGEPLWVANDICDVLGYKNSRDALAKLDDDERRSSEFMTPGGLQELNTINESGLYALIIRSNKPEAKPFKRWITHEVLPSIRKTGQYSVSNENVDIPKILQLSDSQLSYLLDKVSSELTYAIETIEVLSDVIFERTRDGMVFYRSVEKSSSRLKGYKNNVDEINNILFKNKVTFSCEGEK